MLHSFLTTLRRAPAASALGVAAFVAITGAMAWRFLVLREPWQLLVDLDVYRDAGESLLIGRPVYEHLTPTPQLLPFTYPPISAVLSVPLTWLPLRPLGWLWSALQAVLLAGVVTVAFRPLLDRFGRVRPVALGVLSGVLLWMLPLRDGIMFGQVDILLLALCFADCVTPHPRWPRGLLIGISTAVKLTPGVFILYLWLSGRRREARTAAVSAVVLSLATFLLIPGDTADFWFRAIFDSDRLGGNAGTANQAMRGALLRFGDGPALLWLPLVVVVGYFGYRAAVRCARAGNELAGTALAGLLAVLLSPVAWIHHMAWVVLSLAVIVGDGRDRRRLLVGAGVLVYFILSIPWTGASMTEPHYFPKLPILVARVVQDAYCIGAVVLLWVVQKYGLRDAAAPAPDARPAEPAVTAAG